MVFGLQEKTTAFAIVFSEPCGVISDVVPPPGSNRYAAIIRREHSVSEPLNTKPKHSEAVSVLKGGDTQHR